MHSPITQVEIFDIHEDHKDLIYKKANLQVQQHTNQLAYVRHTLSLFQKIVEATHPQQITEKLRQIYKK